MCVCVYSFFSVEMRSLMFFSLECIKVHHGHACQNILLFLQGYLQYPRFNTEPNYGYSFNIYIYIYNTHMSPQNEKTSKPGVWRLHLRGPAEVERNWLPLECIIIPQKL